MYKALDVAYWFINKNRTMMEHEETEKITLLKVLKLLYYAEGCHLALFDDSLFNEKIMAWEYGPVVQEVYRTFNGDPYNLTLPDNYQDIINSFSSEDNDFLEDVYNVFGKYDAWALKEMTHNETPWIEATDNGTHLNDEINRQTMKEYFKEHYVA